MKDLKLKDINKKKSPEKFIKNFRLHKNTIKKLEILAKENNTSMTKVIEYLINEKVS